MMHAAGTFPWLLAHDLRLGWRGLSDMLGNVSPRRRLLWLGAGALLLHLAAWPVVAGLAPFMWQDDATPLASSAIIGGMFAWMLAQSLFSASRTLYDRADLDLLLGAPLPAARIMAAKAVSIMTGTLGSVALLVVPLANTGAIIDRLAWLGIYPVLTGLALTATSLGICMAMGIFFLVGPRRARTYAQLLGAGLGGGFILAVQIYAMLPDGTRSEVSDWLRSSGLADLLGNGTLIGLPAVGLSGDISAMAIVLFVGVVLFVVTTTVLGERFATAAIAAAGAATDRHGDDEPQRVKFRAGIGRSLRLKEWRLLIRDPAMFTQLALQIIYTIPVAVLVLRSEVVPLAIALVPTIVLIASQVTGSIAWLTVSGEDAPELLATAPVATTTVERTKLSAVALPILLFLAIPLAGLAFLSLKAAAITLCFAAGGGASTALLNFWHPMPGNRRGMLRRHQQSKLIGLVEHGLAALWAFASILAVVGSWLAIGPIAIAAGVLAFSRARHRRQDLSVTNSEPAFHAKKPISEPVHA